MSKKNLFGKSLIIGVLFLVFNIFLGCAEKSVVQNSLISTAVNSDNPLTDGDEIIIDNDDSYYIALENKLNDDLDINRAPDKCAAQGLTKVVLNFTTDEIQTCTTYDLSKVTTTAYFSDKTAEVVTPIWSIYSGSGTLDGTIYTATNKPAIIVFKALFTENGISKLALFRLTVMGLVSISLNKTTDEIQLPATYDLSTELLVTAKLSNGTTKTVVKGDPNLKWTLASGAGTLTDGVYTPSAKVETATFTANYAENGVTKAAKFKLKVAGLSSLILSQTTDEVNSCETYDLASKIVVSNKLSNGTVSDITASPNLTWVLSSGTGILEGKIYTAPAKAETAVFTASYTEAGITKTAQFRLKVTGLSSVVLDKTTDEIMLPATYDLASEIHAIAKFSDGDSKSVDLIWALSSGAGTLSGTVYTPASKPETALFIGSYIENGITKTAQFRLKVIGLSSLTLSKTTDEVVSCATYDLSQIVVSDKLSNGTINNVSNSTTWKLVSGFGTLSGTIYTAPARAETAAFTANYTEAGITKTVQFRLKVIALASIKLSKATDEAQILAPYDLVSNIAVTAKLSNGQLKPISGNDPNLKWTRSYGSGILSGTLYTPPERIETAVLTATYTENGVAQSAQFRLKSTATLRGKIELVGLALTQTTDSVRIGQTYDLSKLTAIAKFADKKTAEVSLSWIVSSGGGSVVGTTYTPPNNIATVKLMGTYTAVDGSVKSISFTLYVYNTIIYGSKGVVTNDGATLNLSNGYIFEIPQNSVEATTTVEIITSKSIDNVKCTKNQTFLTIVNDKKIYNLTVRIPISNAQQDKVILTCIISSTNDVFRPSPIIEDSMCIYNLGPIYSPPSVNSSTVSKSAAYLSVTDPLYGLVTNSKVTPFEGRTEFIVYKDDDIARKAFKESITIPSQKFDWPFYRQFSATCLPTTLLMLLKGYKNDLNHDFDSIFKITYKIIADIKLSDKNLQNNEIFHMAGGFVSSRPLLKNGLITEMILSLFAKNSSRNNLVKITQSFASTTLTAYYCEDRDALKWLVPTIISQKRPLKVDSGAHSVLICGYTYENDTMTYVIHDPAIDKNGLYRSVTEPQFHQTMGYDSYDFPYVCYCIENQSPVYPMTLQTIHLSDEHFSLKIIEGGIHFRDSDDKIFLRSQWDPFVEHIEWKKKSDDTGDSAKFDAVVFKNIPIINAGMPKLVFVQASIKNTNISAPCKIFDDVSKSEIDSPNFTISKDDGSNNLITFRSKALVSKLMEGLKNGTINSGSFNLIVELKDAVTLQTLDKFDVDFEYTYHDLTIAPKTASETGDIKVNTSRQYKCMYNNDDISQYVSWYYKIDGGSEIPFDGLFRPTITGSYTLIARVRNNSGAPSEIWNKEITIEVKVVNFVVYVAKKKIGLGEKTSFYGIYDGTIVETSKIIWSLIDYLGNFLHNYFSFLGFAPKFNSPIFYAPADPSVFKAPLESGNYTLSGLYNGIQDSCSVEVMPLEMTCEVPLSMKLDDIVAFKVKITGITEPKEISVTSDNGEVFDTNQVLIQDDYSMVFTFKLKLKENAKQTANSVFVKADIINFDVTRTTEGTIKILRNNLKIAPASAELKMKQQLKFTALLNDATIETGILWSTESAGGTINSSGSYTAPVKPGTYLVTAKYEDVEATAEVRVIPSDFKIAPKQTTLIYGQQQQFAATVDNLSVDTNLTWSVEDANGGSINSTGQYTAPNSVGTYIVKALYYGELEATAEVTVQAPVLQIDPSTKTLYTNETQNFTLLVNNATQEAEVQWTSTGGGIGSNDGTYLAPNHAGTYIVTAMFRTVEATAEVIVKEHEIKLTPPSAEMNIGQQVQFTAFVDNATAETGVSWSTDVMGGTVTQTGLYTAPSLPGVHRVTAKYQGAETSAEVTVNSLFLTPLTYQLRTDQTVQFDLKYGTSEDTTNEVTTQALWKVVPEVGSVSSGLYTPAAVGNYKVTAEYAGMILTAEVTVTAADLKISPPSAVLNRSQQMTFKALVGDTTQETGISWSVVSPSGGSITQAGVYTAPAQWGKYVIKAAYQGIEATAEVKVNDERIRLQTTDTYMLDANALPMKADGSPLYESSGRSFSIEVYGGIDVSTLELSLVEGNDKGRLVYSSKSGTTGYSPIRYYYYYYAPNSTKPYYDTNEIVHISAKCPENSSTVAQRTVILLRPLLSDTIEINDSANGRKWQFKSLGYRTQNNTWSNYGYKTGSYMIHGTYLGIFNGATSPSYIQQYYCGEADGAHKTYLYMPGDERNGKLAALNVFSNFINYKHERWEYTWENRTDPKTGYVSGPYKITNKVTENYQRANINVGWGATSPNVYEKFDGWVTP